MAEEPSVSSAQPLAAYYDEQYYAHYAHDVDTPYRRDEPVWMSFFGEMARQIVAELAPRTVLDAGCAMGLLVESLRDRGVDAWGLDFSRYAIAQVRPDLSEFCRVASVTDELERDYDLITCIEVLEHLPADQADRAVANFARHADTVLLSSTPDDYREPTHLNVQPSDYWVGLFACHGLYRDLDFDAYFVSQHAMLFRRQRGLPIDTLRAYERRLWHSRLEIRELRSSYQSSIETRVRLETDLEHHTFERELLSGEATHWEWRTGLTRNDAAGSQRRAEEAARKLTASNLFPRGSQLRESVLARAAGQAISLLRRVAQPNPTGQFESTSASQPVSPVAPSSGAVRVLFISDGSEGPRHYRCEHQAESLRLCGWSADVITYEDSFGFLTPQLESYDAFVLQRLPLRPNLDLFIQGARERAKPLVYDSDDLIFDPDLAAHWAPFASMSDHERRLTKHGMWRNRQALRLCDAVIVSTEALRPLAQAVHSRVYVSTNAVSQTMQLSAEEALKSRAPWREGDAITLGYLSGTPTHNRDFSDIADALKWALETYSATRLLVVGPVDLPAQFEKLDRRVQRLSLQPWHQLPRVQAEVSINLAPLEAQNPFTEAKSCVKYLEAGVLGVPTIASPRPDFARVIRDQENGFLADSPEVWQKALSALVESPSMRTSIGERARHDILRRHTTAARGGQIQGLILDLIARCASGRT